MRDLRRSARDLCAGLFLFGAACQPRVVIPPDATPCSPPTSTAGPLFLVHPAARTVFQRDPATSLGEIVVEGFYDAALAGVEPSAVEARWGEGAWQVIDADPHAGAFGGVLAGADAFLGRQPIEVRFANATAVARSVADVGVGDVFAVAGQSNAELWLTTTSASALGASTYRFGTDLHDPERVRWAADPLMNCSAFRPGSVYPALMDRLIAANGVPVMFVAGARPDTRIAEFQPGTVGFDPLLQNVADATAGTMGLRFLLWLQGESDVGWLATAEYVDLFLSFFDALQAELAGPTPMLVATLGSIENGVPIAEGGTGTFAEVEAIRAAQRELPAHRPEIRAGPDLTGLPIDGFHFDDPAAPGLLEGWCAAIDVEVSGVDCPAG